VLTEINVYKVLYFTIPQTKEDMERFKLPSLNSMIGGTHFSMKAAARKRFEKWFQRRIILCHRPIFETAVIRFTLYRSHFLDQDNCFGIAKVINDALVNIGVFKTDRFPALRTVIDDQIKCPKTEQRILITVRPQPTEETFHAFVTTATGLPVLWQQLHPRTTRNPLRSGVPSKRGTKVQTLPK
jgi:hypothetical protein